MLGQRFQHHLALKGLDILTRRLGSEALAWAFICQMAGTILMARAMPDKATQIAVLDAGKRFLKEAVARLPANAAHP